MFSLGSALSTQHSASTSASASGSSNFLLTFHSLDEMSEAQQSGFAKLIADIPDQGQEQVQQKAAEIIRNSTSSKRAEFFELIKSTRWQSLSRTFNKSIFPNQYTQLMLKVLPDSVDQMDVAQQLELSRLIKDAKCPEEKLQNIFTQSTGEALFNFFADPNVQARFVKGVMRGDITDPRILDGLRGARSNLSKEVQNQIWGKDGRQMLKAMTTGKHDASLLFLFKFFPDLAGSEQKKIAKSIFYEWLPRNAATLHTLDEHLNDFPFLLKKEIKAVVIDAIVKKIFGDGSNPQQVMADFIAFRKMANPEFAETVGLLVIGQLGRSSHCVQDRDVQFLVVKTIANLNLPAAFLAEFVNNLPNHVTDPEVHAILSDEHFQVRFVKVKATEALEVLKQKLLPPEAPKAPAVSEAAQTSQALVVRESSQFDLYPGIHFVDDVDIGDGIDVAPFRGNVLRDQAAPTQPTQSNQSSLFSIFPMPVNELLVYLGMAVAGVAIGIIAWNTYQEGAIEV